MMVWKRSFLSSISICWYPYWMSGKIATSPTIADWYHPKVVNSKSRNPTWPDIHPWKLTCHLKGNCFNRTYIFQPLIILIYCLSWNYLHLYIPEPSKGCQLNPKGMCNGYTYCWKVQIFISWQMIPTSHDRFMYRKIVAEEGTSPRKFQKKNQSWWNMKFHLAREPIDTHYIRCTYWVDY